MILFLTDKRRINDVERLFQVGITFPGRLIMMSLAAVQRILGLLLTMFSFTLMPPFIASPDGAGRCSAAFASAFALTLESASSVGCRCERCGASCACATASSSSW